MEPAPKRVGQSYLTLTKDMTRVMNRKERLHSESSRRVAGKADGTRVRIRAEHLYQQLDSLKPVRLEARRQLLLESRKHAAVKLLRQIPSIGPIRASLPVALLQTPNRFRTKRQLWAYSGFAVEVHDSGEYRWGRGKLQRNRERITVRGLNDNYNKDVKYLFKGAAISASTRPDPLHDFYVA
jgi:transposase